MRSSVAQRHKTLLDLLKALRHVVLTNDFRAAQRHRLVLANAKRFVEDPLRDHLNDLFEISGQWVRGVGNRHDNRRLIQRSIGRILARL
jgi:hypothetical protein